MTKTALVCPGQGAQKPGMLAPWLERPGATEYVRELSEAAELDLIQLGTEADKDAIRNTEVAQPLIVASGALAIWLANRDERQIGADVVAGHSIGELTASIAAGVLTPTDAVRLAAIRGRAMAEACNDTPTGMSAVLVDPRASAETYSDASVANLLDAIGNQDLTVANHNASFAESGRNGQIVVAGRLENLADFVAPEGFRVVPLEVAGAFHTEYMRPAVETLRQAAAEIAPNDPNACLLTNRDGEVVESGAEFLDFVVEQVTRPVRWDKCTASFGRLGVSRIVELPPAGVLARIAQKTMPKGTATVPIRKPGDL